LRRTLRIAALGAVTLLASAPAGARDAPTDPAPQRVVSINVCTDALLSDLLPRERIVSVTFLGADPRYSPRADALAGIPRNRGGADEVLAMRPDLVVGGRHARMATVSLLRRLGVKVITLELATSLADAREQVLELSRALGVEHRGRTLVARMDARLARARAPPGAPRPLTALLRPNGFTVGPDTLAGAVLEHAGFENLAARLGIRSWGFIGLERLLLARPHLVVLETATREPPSQAAALLLHPAFASADSGFRRIALSGVHLGCPGPWIADAATRLAAARRRVVP
jgi:iron complex transport system substrate-binding protein